MLRGERAPGDRWTDHDRSVAVAFTLYEATLCSGCGQPLEESTAAEADPSNSSGAWHYESPAPVRCHACTAVAVAREGFEAPHPHALRWHATRVDDQP